MPKPILVGYDPRSADRAPVDWGVAAARFTGAPLVVASVHAALTAARPNEGVDADLLADCAAAVGALERDLQEAGITVECRILSSTSAARALHDAAEELHAGLLVVGSTRRSAAGRVLPGTTAERLLHGAPCPIAVVPAAWRAAGGPRTIGVAYADSHEGREALRGAHALARRAGATLRVLTVVTVGVGRYAETEPTVAGRIEKTDVEDVEGRRRVEAEEDLRRRVAELGGDVPVEVAAFIGDPAEIIVALSERLDLLVCGSRGYGPVRAVLLGSVSRRVVAAAHCPVIVLPRGVPAALEALVAPAPGAAARA